MKPKEWTVGKASWIHMPGFEWAMFWGDSERCSLKYEKEAQDWCSRKNDKKHCMNSKK